MRIAGALPQRFCATSTPDAPIRLEQTTPKWRSGGASLAPRPSPYDESSSRRTTPALQRPSSTPATVSETWCCPR